MGFVTDQTKRVEIPHEPGEWFEFRRLSWRQLERASEANMSAVLRKVKLMGGDVLRELQAAQARSDVQVALADPLSDYDLAVLLSEGIVAWSYDRAVDPQAIDELDSDTVKWAGREIIALATPSSEEERKNG